MNKPILNDDTMTRLAELRSLFLRDPDLRKALPRFPRLSPEYLRIPFGNDRMLIYGPKDPVMLKSRKGHWALANLLARLDGETATEDLVKDLHDPESAALFDVIVALTRAAAIEDGARSHDPQDPILSYFGRFAIASGKNRNRDEALHRLAVAHLLVAASGFDVCGPLEALRASGRGRVTFATPDEPLPANATFALFLVNGEAAPLRRLIIEAHSAGVPHLIVRMGENKTDIGPFVMPGASAGYDCLERSLAPPGGVASEMRAQIWGHQAAHLAIGILTMVTGSAYLNQVHRISDRFGAPFELHRIPMVPGSQTSPIAADAAYDSDETVRKIWLHHMATRRPAKQLLSVHSHFNHFTAANIKLTGMATRRYFGQGTVTLPDKAIEAGVPWLSDQQSSGTAIDLDRLSAILKHVAGYTSATGTRHRIAPTGGGLQSPTLFLHVKDVDGLKDGGYRYYGPDHALEPLSHLDWDTANGAAASDRMQVRVFNVAWLGKVRSKYSDFGYSIVHYDAGVALAYARICSEAFAVPMIEEPLVSLSTVERAFNLQAPTHDYLPTSVFSLGGPVGERRAATTAPLEQLMNFNLPHRPIERPPISPVALSGALASATRSASLSEISATRRSINTFRDGIVSGELLEDIIRIAHNATAAVERMAGLRLELWPLLLRVRGDTYLPAGIYAVKGPEKRDWLQRKATLSRAELASCINQEGLTTADNIVVMIGNLPKAVTDYGKAGYSGLLARAGNIVGSLWLATHAAGLSCTAAGGVLEPGIAALASCDGYTECPLLSFVLGESELAT